MPHIGTRKKTTKTVTTMNEKIRQHIEEVAEHLGDQAKQLTKNSFALAKVQAVLAKVDAALDSTVGMNCYGGSCWFDVYNREDLKALMVIAPIWNKTTQGDVIEYQSTIDGVVFRINAHDAALPSTCKLVEEEVTIPAQPERVEKRMVVKCNQPTPVELSPEALTNSLDETPV